MKTISIKAARGEWDEVGIIKAISEGWTVKSIAITNGVDKGTLQNKIVEIRRKYNCASSFQLVAMFARQGII